MKKTVIALIAVAVIFTGVHNTSANHLIDLSNAKSGTLIKVPGASFSQIFAGETLSGPEVVGMPSNPLTLTTVGDLIIESIGNIKTITSEITYNGPLSVLLNRDATSISFTMGHGQSPAPVKIDFFASDGSLVHTVEQSIYNNYNTYHFKDFGAFRGFTIYCNDDPAGLRYYNFQYDDDRLAAEH